MAGSIKLDYARRKAARCIPLKQATGQRTKALIEKTHKGNQHNGRQHPGQPGNE